MTKTARVDRVGAFQVETWWDRSSRNWITELTCPREGPRRGGALELQPGGDADFSGSRQDAELAHRWALERAAELDRIDTAAEIAAAVDSLPAVRAP